MPPKRIVKTVKASPDRPVYIIPPNPKGKSPLRVTKEPGTAIRIIRESPKK